MMYPDSVRIPKVGIPPYKTIMYAYPYRKIDPVENGQEIHRIYFCIAKKQALSHSFGKSLLSLFLTSDFLFY